MLKLDLYGQWKMRPIEDSEWLDVQVPGSVMKDLLEHDKMDDPFYRDQEKDAHQVLEKDYIYLKTFHVEEEILSQDKVFLVSEGLDTLADIFINGTHVKKTDNMHRIYHIDVKDILKIGENEITIKFSSALRYITERQKISPLTGVKEAIDGYPHIRKAHYMFGWDWGPQLPDMGIWRPISIQAWSAVKLDDVYISQTHTAEDVAVNVRVALEKMVANPPSQIEVTLTAPNGAAETQTIAEAEEVETVAFQVSDPQLWWPNGYGDQPLYEVKVSVQNNGHVADSRTYSIGLRTIEVAHEPDEFGKSFTFIVNGTPIFAMGANYIPEDNILGRNSYEKTERLLKDSVEANFNMVRIWGGGHYPEDYFFELCDRLGLIVWQDFMFGCSVYELTDEFLDSVKKEAVDQIKRLRHHASLGIWCGNNEVEEGWVYWGWPQEAKRKADYLKLFEIILPEIVKEHDPQRFYWSSSPSSGGGFDEPRDPNRGDMHYWEVWHGLKPFTEYRKYYFRFCSEFGFQSFPSLKTVESFTLPEDRNIFSKVMESHQKNSGANGKILFYLSENFLYPKDFESLLYVSQLLQAEAIKYGVEHWRRNRGRCMGSLYWQLNDCWPVASWSSIDSFGRWKALHYFAKRFYAPILLSIEEEGKQASVYVTNETFNLVDGQIIWKLRKNTSEVLQEGTTAVKVDSLSAHKAIDLSFEDVLSDDDLANTYLECSFIEDGEVQDHSILLFVKPKHFEFVDPQLVADIIEEQDHFIVTIEATAGLAKYVELELTEADCKFSDNYFDLSAGEKKELIIEKSAMSKPLKKEDLIQQLSIRSIYDTY